MWWEGVGSGGRVQVCGGGSRWWGEGAGGGGECRWCVCCVESCMAHEHEYDVQWVCGIYT